MAQEPTSASPSAGDELELLRRKLERETQARIQAETILEQKSTEHYALNSQLTRALEEVQESNKNLNDFAYIISHDLKAPLRMISSFGELLKRNIYEQLDKENKEFMDYVISNAHQLQEMIEAVLQYSRVGRMNLEEETVHLPTLIENVLRLHAQEKKVHHSLNSDVEQLCTRTIMLEQVLGNLISNAIKHNDKEEAQLEISVKKSGPNALFCITDNGPGIPAKDRERVFLMFQTLKPPKVNESGGVGLAIVKKIIEVQGGKIWIEDRKNEPGICFCFTWPEKGKDLA